MGTGVHAGWREPCSARPLRHETTDGRTWPGLHRLPLRTTTSGEGWGRGISRAPSHLFSYLGVQVFQGPTAPQFMSAVPENQK